MSDEQLKALYQRVVMEHNRNPRNTGVLDTKFKSSGENPMCGDEITVYVLVDDDIIKQVRFDAKGCALLKASASIMTELLEGTEKDDALLTAGKLQQYFSGQEELEDIETYGDIAALNTVREFSSRIKCVTLPFAAFKGALQFKKKITTEVETV